MRIRIPLKWFLKITFAEPIAMCIHVPYVHWLLDIELLGGGGGAMSIINNTTEDVS